MTYDLHEIAQVCPALTQTFVLYWRSRELCFILKSLHWTQHPVDTECVSAVFFSHLSHACLMEKLHFYFNQHSCLHRLCNSSRFITFSSNFLQFHAHNYAYCVMRSEHWQNAGEPKTIQRTDDMLLSPQTCVECKCAAFFFCYLTFI